MRKLYAGCDLHSNSNFVGIVDEQGKRIFKKRVANEPQLILEALRPYQEEIVGIVVESTYNWYWLVDTLMDERYQVHLANPSAIQQYVGLKHSDDQHDAFWLAEMLRLGILPEGYIYPKEDRPVRDLLRKRTHLVRLRTSLILSLQNIVSRNVGRKMDLKDVKALKEDRIGPLLERNEDLALAGRVSKEVIDHLTYQIHQIERVVQKKIHLKPEYRYLPSLFGVGKILSLTIMMETGPILRFPTVGDYASYCRKVPSRWTTNGSGRVQGIVRTGISI